MQPRIGIQPVQQSQQFDFGCGLVENLRFGEDAELLAGFFFAPDVHL